MLLYVTPDWIPDEAALLTITVLAWFYLVALGALASPLWLYQRGLRTLYVVTNRRLLVLIGWLRPSLRDYDPWDLTTNERKERPDGSGTVYLLRQRGAIGGLEKRVSCWSPTPSRPSTISLSLKRGDWFGTGRRIDPSLLPTH